jgi:hypothetical protein
LIAWVIGNVLASKKEKFIGNRLAFNVAPFLMLACYTALAFNYVTMLWKKREWVLKLNDS